VLGARNNTVYLQCVQKFLPSVKDNAKMPGVVRRPKAVGVATPGKLLPISNDRLCRMLVRKNDELEPAPGTGILLVDPALVMRIGAELELCNAINEGVI
jgi:hypothetical protein